MPAFLGYKVLLLGFFTGLLLMPSSAAGNQGNSNGKDPGKLAQRITRNCGSDAEKAEVIFKWVTRHIRYDWRAFLNFRRAPSDPRLVLKRKKAVCDGYSLLYQQMCKAVGLDAYLIFGHVKGVFHREGEEFLRAKHAWNGLLLDGRPYLLDATWGSGYVTHRRQPLRQWLYRKFEIPYLPKLKFVRRANMDYFKASPEFLLQSHLPIDPKWQLRDSAIVLEEWERDSLHPKFEIAYEAEIHATTALTEAQRQVLEGSHGWDYNVEDPFDLGVAQVAEAIEVMEDNPSPQADTLAWFDAAEEFDSARTLMVASKAIFVAHHRSRLLELGLRRRQNTLAEGKTLRDAAVTERFTKRETMRFARRERSLGGLGNLHSATAKSLSDPRALNLRVIRKVDTLKWAPLLEALQQSNAGTLRLDSIIAEKQMRLLGIYDTLLSKQDSLLGLRTRALGNVRHYNWEMMNRREVQLYRGCRVLSAIQDSVSAIVRIHSAMLKQDEKVFASQIAQQAQVNRLYLKARSQVQRLVALGMPQPRALNEMQRLVTAHHAWVDAQGDRLEAIRPIQKQYMERLGQSMAVARRCGYLGGWQRRVFLRYHREMWHREQCEFETDMRLASNIRRDAGLGIAVLRGRIRDWLAQKRRQEAAARS